MLKSYLLWFSGRNEKVTQRSIKLVSELMQNILIAWKPELEQSILINWMESCSKFQKIYRVQHQRKAGEFNGWSMGIPTKVSTLGQYNKEYHKIVSFIFINIFFYSVKIYIESHLVPILHRIFRTLFFIFI